MEAGIHLIVRSMIARYGDRAAANAANRARVLDACGDRETSRYWDLVRERIEEFGRSPRRRRRGIFDDDPDLVAAVRETAFGDGAQRIDSDIVVDNEADDDPIEPGDDSEPSSR